MVKSNFLILTAAASALAIAGCTKVEDTSEKGGDAKAEKTAWGYSEEDGPARWGDLSEEYEVCKTGKEQSPVDLPAAANAKTTTVSNSYGTVKAKIADKGYTVQADFPEAFKLTSGENEYSLLQLHMHTPSENTLEGKAFPLTAHLVHADADGNLAVLGVMFEEGEANAALQSMLDNVDGEVEFDIPGLLPSDMTVYNFPGSLTTPPCSEGVNWHVLTTPVSASAEQIAALNKSMGNNARPVQPLNERVLNK